MSKKNTLLKILFQNPTYFWEKGYSNSLLNEYFYDFEYNSLLDILSSNNMYIKRVGIWICSELGEISNLYVDNIVNLVKDDDLYIKAYCLEIIVGFFCETNLKYITLFFDNFESKNKKLRVFCMNTLESLSKERLIKLSEFLSNVDGYNTHIKYLNKLIDFNQLSVSEIFNMIDSDNPTLRKYGAIIVGRYKKNNDTLLNYILNQTDEDLIEYANIIKISTELYNTTMNEY